MLSIFGALAIFLLDVGVSNAECPIGWLHHNTSCYLFGSDILNWYDASNLCSIHHSTLVSVESYEENQFLKREAMVRKDSFWLGGMDDIIEGMWTWSSTEKPFAFTDWSPHQPDNRHRNEDCLLMYQRFHWLWDDVNCIHEAKFICEKSNPIGESSIVGK